jgi:tetratricopeptide (TPR) repeat protein
MGRRLDALDHALERVVTLLFGPQPLGYRPAPALWAKLVALAFLAAVVAFGVVASWGPDGRRSTPRRPRGASDAATPMEMEERRARRQLSARQRATSRKAAPGARRGTALARRIVPAQPSDQDAQMAGMTAHGTSQGTEGIMRGWLIWLTGLACLGPGLVTGAGATDAPPRPAASPPPYQRMLRGEDARNARELEEKLGRALKAVRFEEALREAEALLALRQKLQGVDHFQTKDAYWGAEAIRRVLKQDAATRRAMAGLPALARQARQQEARARHREAQAAWDKVLALLRRVLGENCPDTAEGYSNLARALNEQGRYAAAQPLFEKAVAIYRKALGEEHPTTAVACTYLAHNLYDQGRYAAAQPLYERALVIERKALGEDGNDTAACYGNLALDLNAQGKYAAAQPLFEKAVAIRRKALGGDHPGMATSYNNLALNLNAQGKYAAAQPLQEKALALHRKALGEEHPITATSYSNLASNLRSQGRYAAAQPLFEKALAIDRRVLGEHHPDTAASYNSLAYNLYDQGRYAAAQPLFQKALAVWGKILGEDHPDTATGYNSVAADLSAQGEYAAAQPLFAKALAIRRKALGEDHRRTAESYGHLASNLAAQGRYADAQPLFEKALAIKRKALGEDHPGTAESYNDLAHNLRAQGCYAAARPVLDKALAIRRKALGEDHPDTAQSYNNLAVNLGDQGRYADAQPRYERALAIRRKSLGEDHPDTANCYNNLGYNLHRQGRYAAGRPLLEKALAIRRKALGEDHPDTAVGYNNLAYNLYVQGQYAKAEGSWIKGAAVFARTRLLVAASGLERAAVAMERTPLPRLAAVLARNGKPEEAWRRFEESLARGTWDDLSAGLRRSPADRDRQATLLQELRRLDRLIERTLAAKQTPELKQRHDDLLTQCRHKQDELLTFTRQLERRYGPVAGEIYGRVAIQQALHADAALVSWVDIPGQAEAADPNGEHWAVLLRAKGAPAWARLRGSGTGGTWTEADTRLSADLRRALEDTANSWHTLADRLREQRLQPLVASLVARDGLPTVRRLVVLPSPALAGVPLEVIAPDYTVSYAPSGTIFAYLRGRPPTDGRGVLALADPIFDAERHKPSRTPLPPGGVLVTMVVPKGNAARAGLAADDVLLRYADSELKDTAELGRLMPQHARDPEVRVTVWRAGQTAERTVAGGALGLVMARRPAPEALTERYKNDQLVAQSRAGAEGDWPELPGTRAEAEGLRRLCAQAAAPFRLLADSMASEQELDRLARAKELARYRYLHLATHGDLNDRLPLQSAVILARDRLPDPLKQLESGQPVYDGRLTAEKVLERWDLHADLVTLSACETALGKYEGGEGFVGFTQALLLSGARSVCLSLWKVDDTATALLMQRFYANLLGQRDGLNKPLGKAEALADAKAWLRDLSAEEAARQGAALTRGVARGKGRKPLPLLPAAKGHGSGTAAKPYAHPYYWAAFVLVGDGN